MSADPVMSVYLVVTDAPAAIEFYSKVFGGTERMRLAEPSGRIGHAEVVIGDSVVMLADEHPELGIVGPKSLGGTPVAMHLRVDDVDAVCQRARENGATIEREPADEFYGARSGTLYDPFGHRWMIQTPTEDVTAEEMQRRYDAALESQKTS
jgi:PhnB protein